MHCISSFLGVPIGKIFLEIVVVLDVFLVVVERVFLTSIPGSILALEDLEELLADDADVVGLLDLVETDLWLLRVAEAVVLVLLVDDVDLDEVT